MSIRLALVRFIMDRSLWLCQKASRYLHGNEVRQVDYELARSIYIWVADRHGCIRQIQDALYEIDQMGMSGLPTEEHGENVH